MKTAAQVLLLAAAAALIVPAVAEAQCWELSYCESYGYSSNGVVYGYSRSVGYYGDYEGVEAWLTDPEWSTVSSWAEGQYEVTAEVWGEAGSSGDYWIDGYHYYWDFEPSWGWNWDGASWYDVWVVLPPPPEITVCPLPSPAWGSGSQWAVIGGSGFWGNTPQVSWSGNGGVNFLQSSSATVTSDSQIDLSVSLAPVTSEGSITLGIGTAACMFAVQPPPPPPTVSITSASIPSDRIRVQLAPQGMSGTLTVKVVQGETTHTVYEGARSAGTHDIIFNIPNLPNGEFTEVRATWAADGQSPSATYNYHFKVLGDYRQTKYNTPDNNVTCSGSTVGFTYLTAQTCQQINCQSAETAIDQALSGWLTETLENGTGLHPSLGIIWGEPQCTGRAAYRRTCRTCPACLALGELVSNQDVAVGQGHPDLTCGDTVYVHQVGVRTVKDRGGEGFGNDHLDHYIGVTGCNQYGTDYGTKKTIKLF